MGKLNQNGDFAYILLFYVYLFRWSGNIVLNRFFFWLP